MVYKCFDKKSAGIGFNMHSNNEYILDLAGELHKPIITKFKKRTVCSRFRDNIWGAHLADVQLISKFNKRFRFLLCIIDIFSKYACVALLKDKVPWKYVINDLNGEEIIRSFYEKELQKTNQQEFRIEKVIKKKGDKLYVKWKRYDRKFIKFTKIGLIKKLD